jgi:diadenylate cyclase
LSAALDILLVAYIVYWLIVLSKGKRAWWIGLGLLIFLLLVFVTDWLQLHTINFLLQKFLLLGPVALVILFYPELRHVLENMGKVAGLSSGLAGVGREDVSSLIQSIVRAACRMSERRIGALIVIEREGTLEDVIATGTRLDAEVSEELIGAIFNPGSPLHDGAVVIRGTRIVAAGCTLPLSESAHVGTMIHTRHKAALGVAEESDAAVVVVSEESGTISLALEGKLHRGLNEETLSRWLRGISGISDDKPRKSELARKVDGTLRRARLRRP